MSILDTSTAICTMMKWGARTSRRADLSSLRLLGTVGEAINPRRGPGSTARDRRRRCPSWTPGGDRDRRHDDSPAARRHPTPSRVRAGATAGIAVDVVDDAAPPQRDDGFPGGPQAVAVHAAHHLGDDERFVNTYWGQFGRR
ncbi:hypothetical protein QJS66_18615 [Kocuria rhizophila]|nr:hypothetical protein QJS66_18615 [Kocuria rhizophila]